MFGGVIVSWQTQHVSEQADMANTFIPAKCDGVIAKLSYCECMSNAKNAFIRVLLLI